MKTSVSVLGLCLPALLIACSNNNSLSESGALDPVGVRQSQQASALVQTSRYKVGEQVTLRNTRTAVFKQNPQRHPARSEIVSAINATVLSPEGLFYRVKFENGAEGYISESDILDSAEMFVTTGSYATGEFPDFMQDDAMLPSPAANSQEPTAPTTEAPIINIDATPAPGKAEELPAPSSKL